MTIEYRIASPADVPELATLRGTEEAGGASEDRMVRYLKGKHHPRDALLPRIMFVATAGDRIIGYVAGHLTQRYGCDGELRWIYVTRDHRGTGVGDELLDLLAGWFVSKGARRVCVDVGDPDATRFYARHGAEVLDGPWMVWKDIGSVGDAERKHNG